MTDQPQTIADFWTSYRRDVVPADAPPVQLIECRRAFYAGAAAMLSGMMDAAGEPGEPGEQDIRRVEDLAGEVSRFALGASFGVN